MDDDNEQKRRFDDNVILDLVASIAELKTDIKYIVKSTDDIKTEMKQVKTDTDNKCTDCIVSVTLKDHIAEHAKTTANKKWGWEYVAVILSPLIALVVLVLMIAKVIS